LEDFYAHIWCRVVMSRNVHPCYPVPVVVQFRDVSPHNSDGLAMSGLEISVVPMQLTHACS